jgi:hypothetical protein
VPKANFRSDKQLEIESQVFALIRRFNTQGLGLEAMAATASALQEGLAHFGANNHIPHFQSADSAMRAVTHLLADPLNERYALDTLELSMRMAKSEFRIIEQQAPAADEEEARPRFPKLVIMDGGLVPTS